MVPEDCWSGNSRGAGAGRRASSSTPIAFDRTASAVHTVPVVSIAGVGHGNVVVCAAAAASRVDLRQASPICCGWLCESPVGVGRVHSCLLSGEELAVSHGARLLGLAECVGRRVMDEAVTAVLLEIV